jgi:hypothetical protein
MSSEKIYFKGVGFNVQHLKELKTKANFMDTFCPIIKTFCLNEAWSYLTKELKKYK